MLVAANACVVSREPHPGSFDLSAPAGKAVKPRQHDIAYDQILVFFKSTLAV
jgi:hypothetical protein